MLRSSSDRAKVAVSLCAIASSSMTLAAYFRAFDRAAPSLVHGTQSIGSPYNRASATDNARFPAELADLMSTPAASS